MQSRNESAEKYPTHFAMHPVFWTKRASYPLKHQQYAQHSLPYSMYGLLFETHLLIRIPVNYVINHKRTFWESLARRALFLKQWQHPSSIVHKIPQSPDEIVGILITHSLNLFVEIFATFIKHYSKKAFICIVYISRHIIVKLLTIWY